ncbi:MAG: hypothetical protein LC623_09850, partial [Halobacteriales archaeon]|nr:hypothetical protein [Halobacteriales archaeon]
VPLTLQRIFWYDSAGAVTFMDFDKTRQVAGLGLANRAAYGDLRQPMLWGYLNAPSFAGLGDWNPQASASGTISMFRDSLCQDPVS